MSKADALPDWLNPKCNANDPADNVQDRMSDTQLIQYIIHQAQIAQGKAKIFIENEFVLKTFKRDFESLRNDFANEYNWLPKIPELPKSDETVPKEEVKAMFQQTLKEVYAFLQQVGVAIERSIEDEKNRDGEFVSSFNEMGDNLSSVLCEVQMALTENGITPPSDVTTAIMGNEQGMDNTSINVRNLIVYRKYLNLLDYIIQVFQYFKTRMA